MKDDVASGLEALESLEACATRLGNAFWRRYALLVLAGNWREVTRAEDGLASEEVENDVQHADEAMLPSRALRLACSGDFVAAYNVVAGSAPRQINTSQTALRWTEIAIYAAAAGLWQAAQEAVTAARRLLRRVSEPKEATSVRARLNLVLALLLVGNERSAARLLSTLKASAPQFPRLRHLHLLLGAMLMCQRGARNHEEILTLLDELSKSGFGGIAMLIEAVPSGLFSLGRAS